MNEQSLSIAFSDSLQDELVSTISEFVEIGLDSVMEDGILEDIPIVKTAVSVYKIGHGIKTRYNIKKLVMFLNEINYGIVDESKRLKYQQKFLTNQKFRNQELEYILILIDRYMNYEKPQMLAKTYLSYLQDEIDWITFCKYSEIIDRFLPEDKEYFLSEKGLYRTLSFPMPDSFIRLSALGLYEEHLTATSVPTTLGTITTPAPKEKTYKLTEFGRKLQDILGGNLPF